MLRQIRSLAALAFCAASASAQVSLNEIFFSHTGTDDREFFEVRGTPGTPLTGYMLLIVEGDSPGFGILDVAVDLSAGVIPASGVYTAGSSTVVPAVDQIVLGPGSPQNVNLFENGTDTFYFIHTTNPGGVVLNIGADMRVGGMGLVTTIATDPAITVIEAFGATDGGAGDTTFDAVTVYTDGTFLPAGLVKCGDAPFGWNPLLLDFNLASTPGYIMPTPTTANPNCNTSSPGTAYCFGDGSSTACPCGNSSPLGNNEGCLHSLGTGGKLIATGTPSVTADTMVLQGSTMPNSSALYFQGTTQTASVFGDGLRCAGGAVIRLGTKTNMAGSSSYPVGADPLISVRGAIPGAGGTRTYQCWYRNAAAFCTVSTFNLTNGWQIVWTP